MSLLNRESGVCLTHRGAAVLLWATQSLREKCKLVSFQPRHAYAVEEIFQFRIGKHTFVKPIDSGVDCGLAADALEETGFADRLAHFVLLYLLGLEMLAFAYACTALLGDFSIRTAHCL